MVSYDMMDTSIGKSTNEFYNPHLTAAPNVDTGKFGTLSYSFPPLQELSKNLYFHRVTSESSTLDTGQWGKEDN